MGNTNAHQLFLGLGLAMSLFFIGMAAVHWAKTLMPDHEVIDHRKEQRSKDEDRSAFVATVKERADLYLSFGEYVQDYLNIFTERQI